jgi:vitamin B12 transporter
MQSKLSVGRSGRPALRVAVALVLVPLAFRCAPASPLAPAQDQPVATDSQPAPAGGHNPPKKSSPSAPINPATSAALPPGRTAAPLEDLSATIEVSVATRNPQLISTTATSSTVLTNDFLKDQNYSRVTDALQSVPGLAVLTSGAPGQVTSVFTRGTNSAETLLTIDGRRQAPDLSNFYDFTNLTFDNVGQVEVDRTPASALQGANAIGGVINLTTLSGRGLATPEGSVAFEGGSFDTFREIAQSLGSFDQADYGVAFSRQDSHFPEPNNDYHNTVYRGNYGYTFSPAIYVDLQTSYTTSRTGDPGIISFPDPSAELYRETWNLSPRLTAQVTDFYTTSVYYNRTQLREVNSDYFNFSHNRSQDNTDAMDWQNDLQLAHNWKITTGVQGDHYEAWDNDDINDYRDTQANLYDIGGYIESQYEPVKDLHLLSSVRYDVYSQFENAFSWRQGVSYKTPVTATILHASVASAYATPSVDDLYSPGFFGYGVGNPNLVPERSLAWEIGAEQPVWNDHLVGSATYFHNDLNNLIEPSGPFDDPINIGHATAQGVELGLTLRPIERVSANVNYTYLDAVDDDTQTRLLRRPRNTINFTATYQPIQPVTIAFGGSWVNGREDIDPYSSIVVDAPDYFVVRANVTWQINNTFSVWVRGENLGDASYQPVLGYPALGRALYGGVKVSF